MVRRHAVRRTALNRQSPLQVGNGNFAMGVDVTGLQSFVPFNIMSSWGWHESPLPEGEKISDFQGARIDTHGRQVLYPAPDPDHPELSQWLYNNPRRLNLGRIGLALKHEDGREGAADDLTGIDQRLELWTGVIESRFVFDGRPVTVVTVADPSRDAITVRVESELIALGRLEVFLDFPYADTREFAQYVGDWGRPDAHRTTLREERHQWCIVHDVDQTQYHVSLRAAGPTTLTSTATNPNAVLKILEARYGTDGHWADVTSILRNLITSESLITNVNYRVLGDPAPGRAKRLELSYEFDGVTTKLTVPDNESLNIGRSRNRHRYALRADSGSVLDFVCAFDPQKQKAALPGPAAVRHANDRAWKSFWTSGAFVDMSGSTDERWMELERRTVLSRYLARVNQASDDPPQEAGLVNNGWNGKFHWEMYWWHSAHWMLWNDQHLLDRSSGIFERLLPAARRRAKGQGWTGARWPKNTAHEGRESPHIIHALLIWQQPHPMFFAELEYRARPTRSTLRKWQSVVEDTAEFLASFAFWDSSTERYVLGPPVHPVSENTPPSTTVNPTFELGYWRFGLRIAQEWRQRLGLPANRKHDEVLQNLAPLPVEDGVYVLHEGIDDMWTRYNYEHPAMTGALGWLPGDGVDPATMGRTLDRIMAEWRLDDIWGWDFPMLAMCAARLGRPELAVDLLCRDSAKFGFDDAGLAVGGPYPYFPSNGGLLYAVGMLAAGWDGAPAGQAPGFPESGWSVRHEGLSPAP